MKLKFEIVLILLLAFSAELLASDQRIRASGFLSAGGQSIGSPAGPRTYDLQGQLFSTRDVTKFGLNLHATLSDEISLAAQFSTTPGTSKNLIPDWYFANWNDGQFSFRFGQLLLPAWLYSETKDIGFTYPWVALPYEVYVLNPMKNFTGLSAGLVNLDVWTGKFTVEFFAGGGRTNYEPHQATDSDRFDINIKEILGFVTTIDRSPDFQYRFSYMRADIEATAFKYITTVSNNIPLLTTLSAPFVDGKIDFTSFGGQHWFGNQLFLFELAQRAVENKQNIVQDLGKINAGYALLGTQQESWFYYLGYSTSERQSGNTSGYLPRTDIPSASLSAISPKTISSLNIGVKKDFAPFLCGKLQYSSVTTKYEEASTQYNFDTPVYGASIDMIF
jgi:hypothetical protein